MKTKITYYIDQIRGSFWFLPMMIVMIAVLLSVSLIYADSVTEYKPKGILAYLFQSNAESSRTILSIIAGAMIGVAGTVFSITIVALTLTSSTYGSRLLRNFMYDRLNQVVLGTYVATFIYCLIILRAVIGEEEYLFIPNFSVLFAIFLAIANIFLLIVFIHHISKSIQSETVITDVNNALSRNVERLFGKKIGKDSSSLHIDPEHEQKNYNTHHEYTAESDGYIQLVDLDRLLEICVDQNIMMRVDRRPGDYIVQGQKLITIYAHNGINETCLDQIGDQLLIGNTRTLTQDPRFAIMQMVEIACRALSPGINDPHTAIACIDRLSSSLCKLSQANFPSAHILDREEKLRMMVKPLTFNGMMDAAFNQIRQNAGASPAVLIRLMDALLRISNAVHNTSYFSSIQRHAAMCLRLGQNNFQEENDILDLEERYKLITEDQNKD